MARRAGNSHPSIPGMKERACRAFEAEDLRPEENTFVKLLNLGLLRSLVVGGDSSLLKPVVADAPRRQDAAEGNMPGEHERQTPDDLLT